jgi:hypothetical protein
MNGVFSNSRFGAVLGFVGGLAIGASAFLLMLLLASLLPLDEGAIYYVLLALAGVIAAVSVRRWGWGVLGIAVAQIVALPLQQVISDPVFRLDWLAYYFAMSSLGYVLTLRWLPTVLAAYAVHWYRHRT